MANTDTFNEENYRPVLDEVLAAMSGVERAMWDAVVERATSRKKSEAIRNLEATISMMATEQQDPAPPVIHPTQE